MSLQDPEAEFSSSKLLNSSAQNRTLIKSYGKHDCIINEERLTFTYAWVTSSAVRALAAPTSASTTMDAMVEGATAESMSPSSFAEALKDRAGRLELGTLFEILSEADLSTLWEEPANAPFKAVTCMVLIACAISMYSCLTREIDNSNLGDPSNAGILKTYPEHQ